MLLYLRPAIEERYIEGYLERIGDVAPEEEMILRDLWDDETQREVVIESLNADSARSEWEDLEVLGYYWGSVFLRKDEGNSPERRSESRRPSFYDSW